MNTLNKNLRQQGFSLLEVLIGIAIFTIGMLALASLQSALTRSTVEAKVRSTAVNIAEQIIETQRGFSQVSSADGIIAYNDITDIISDSPLIFDSTMTRDPVNPVGVTFTVTQEVTDYYYNLAGDSFTTAQPAGINNSDYKTVAVTVSWNDDRNFVIDEGKETSDNLGGGQLVVAATISAVSAASTGRISSENDNLLFSPDVDYSPGSRPDTVSLSLGNNKFKESLLPEPDVTRLDELVETRFDVITYSQTNPGAVFLRREEFMAVSCECQLKAPPGDAAPSGRRPLIWAGDEYVRGQFVSKSYGVSANNQQSEFCDVCCRDHHDGGYSEEDHADTSVNKFGPFKQSAEYHGSGSFTGDHKHYTRSNTGVLTLASTENDTYVEACRLTRQDGFFRVAQDFRREDMNIFPGDFLDDEAEVSVYSDYATTAALSYAAATYQGYEAGPPCIGGISPCVAEAKKQGDYNDPLAEDEIPSWTTLPLGGNQTQQLRSRGIYIDYLSYDMRQILANCDPYNDTADDAQCKSGDIVLDKSGSLNHLELMPFFDVQMTLLNRWNENPINVPVDAKNEPLADNNTHQRGIITKYADGGSTVFAKGHRGNLGFTDSAPIDGRFGSQTTSASIYVHAGVDTTTPGVERFVGGELTENVNGVQASDIDVEGQNGVLCDRTPSGFICRVVSEDPNARVKLFGYGKQEKDLWACLVNDVLLMNSQVINGVNAQVIYELGSDPLPAGTDFNVNIQDTSCN